MVDNQLTEFSPDGTLIKRIAVPAVSPDLRQPLAARGLAIGAAGSALVVNGAFHPILSEYVDGIWRHHAVDGWTNSGGSPAGCIARYRDLAFVLGRKTSREAEDGSKDEILRLHLGRHEWQRWEGKPYYALSVGLDGLLYAFANGIMDVYDPGSFTLVRSFRPRHGIAFAVNAAGELFAVSGTGLVYHLHPDGSLRNQAKIDEQLNDIAIATSGQVVASTYRGTSHVTDETLATVTSFVAGKRVSSVALGTLGND